MKPTSRRNVLKGIAGVSVSRLAGYLLPGAAASIAGCCQQKYFTLNVLLHGLFLLDFRRTHIKLLAPDVPGHIYKAGSWDPKYVYPLGCGRYKLKGLDNTSSLPAMNTDFLIVVRKQEILTQHSGFYIDECKSRINVDLPFPNEIRPLRVLKGCVHFGGTDGGFFRAMGMSLCPVLIYRYATPSVELHDSDWKYCMNKDCTTANLHIWAEPEERVDPQHGAMAYEELRKLTCPNLDFQLETDMSPPIDCSVDVPGVEPFEEQGWAEWGSGAEGTRPVNCNPHLFVNATT
jgi:hypothetical protein